MKKLDVKWIRLARKQGEKMCHCCGHRVRKGVVYNGNFIHLKCAITLSELYMKMLEKRIKILEELKK